MGGEQGREHEETPDAVDDGRHARQQLDGGAQGPAQPGRTGLGQEQGNAKAHRHGDDQGDDGGDHGAVDGGEGTVLILGYVPDVGPEKGRPELLEYRHGLEGQGDQDARQGSENDEGEHQGHLVEQHVLDLELADLGCVDIDGCGFAHGDNSWWILASFASPLEYAKRLAETIRARRPRPRARILQPADYLMVFSSASTIFTTFLGSGTKPSSSAILPPLFRDQVKKSTTPFCLAASAPFS